MAITLFETVLIMPRLFHSVDHRQRVLVFLLTFLFLLLFSLLSPLPAFAGERPLAASEGEMESLSAVVALALNNHPQIRAERAEIEAAQQDLDAARWARFPTFGMEGRQDEFSRDSSVARIEQPLWSGGRISSQIDRADAGVTLRESSLEAVRLSLTEEVMKFYFDVLRLERKWEVARDNEREHTRLVETMRNRVDAEVSPQADLTLAESRLSQAVTARLQVQRELVVARDRLNELSGQYLGSLQWVEADGFDSARGLADWQQLALQFSPERRTVLAEIEQSGSERKLALAQSLPTVVLGHEEKLGDLDYAGESRGVNYIAVNMQLGAGLSSVSAVRAASRREQAARHRLSAQEIQIRSQIQALWAEVEALRDQLPSVLSSTRGASQIVDSYLRQFQVGKKSWLDVLNVQREKAQAFYSLADTEMGLTLARFRLLAMAGLYRSGEGESK